MRKENIRLLAAARQGDDAARCELGRRYLLGTQGFPRHVPLGLEYLTHGGTNAGAQACIVIAECLPLHEILNAAQLPALQSAAHASSVAAMTKIGVWSCLKSSNRSSAEDWLERAAVLGGTNASAALNALRGGPDRAIFGVLSSFSDDVDYDAEALLAHALSAATRSDDGGLLGSLVDAAAGLRPSSNSALAVLVCEAVVRGQSMRGFRITATAEDIERLLGDGVRRKSADAALLLGRALCGMDTGSLHAGSATRHANMRKGAALLLRAADAGRPEAWMLLYRVHSDHGASVANPQMARFFLSRQSRNQTGNTITGVLMAR